MFYLRCINFLNLKIVRRGNLKILRHGEMLGLYGGARIVLQRDLVLNNRKFYGSAIKKFEIY